MILGLFIISQGNLSVVDKKMTERFLFEVGDVQKKVNDITLCPSLCIFVIEVGGLFWPEADCQSMEYAIR